MAKHTLAEALAFLNESRKQQLIRLMARADQLPVYYPGDEEVYLKAAGTADGELFGAVFNLGTDPIDRLRLVTKQTPKAIYRLTSDGSRQEVPFCMEGSTAVLDTPSCTLDPVILFLT